MRKLVKFVVLALATYGGLTVVADFNKSKDEKTLSGETSDLSDVMHGNA